MARCRRRHQHLRPRLQHRRRPVRVRHVQQRCGWRPASVDVPQAGGAVGGGREQKPARQRPLHRPDGHALVSAERGRTRAVRRVPAGRQPQQTHRPIGASDGQAGRVGRKRRPELRRPERSHRAAALRLRNHRRVIAAVVPARKGGPCMPAQHGTVCRAGPGARRLRGWAPSVQPRHRRGGAVARRANLSAEGDRLVDRRSCRAPAAAPRSAASAGAARPTRRTTRCRRAVAFERTVQGRAGHGASGGQHRDGLRIAALHRAAAGWLAAASPSIPSVATLPVLSIPSAARCITASPAAREAAAPPSNRPPRPQRRRQRHTRRTGLSHRRCCALGPGGLPQQASGHVAPPRPGLPSQASGLAIRPKPSAAAQWTASPQPQEPGRPPASTGGGTSSRRRRRAARIRRGGCEALAQPGWWL
eukprot:scaffold1670_cov108-Isochrysis_galbana.AAC.2